MKPLASVIIVVKNEHGIAQTLEGLRDSHPGAPFEVIVVDASMPDRLADIKRKHSWVRWEHYPAGNRRTTPQQRNRGLELAKGEIIAFIDANFQPAPGWLAGIIAAIKSGEAIVCGTVHDLNNHNLVHYGAKEAERGYVGESTT